MGGISDKEWGSRQGMGFQNGDGVPVRDGVPHMVDGVPDMADGVPDKGWNSRHRDGVPDMGMGFQTWGCGSRQGM